MSDFKSVMKGGWHPKGRDGGKESWRGDFKGINQVAGWMGKSKQPGDGGSESAHVSKPLATLKDPAAFGPPPKNVNYHGGAALPNEITPHTGGLGAPLTQHQITSARDATAPVEEGQEAPQRPPPPPLPYRADRTGLRTDNLPAPPTHRELAAIPTAHVPQSQRATPNLPPRLPSRQNTISPPATTASPPPPPSYNDATSSTGSSALNQSAINRLGSAGVSVAGFGIGRSNNNNASPVTAGEPNPWKSEQSQNTGPSMSELQSRFNRINKSFNSNNNTGSTVNNAANGNNTSAEFQQQQAPPPPSWKQTRSALTTANSAYKDPSSVSLADVQSTAQTAQNAQRSATAFRERHNETITAAQTRATQINKKHNLTGRLNQFLEDANSAHDQRQQPPPPQPPQPVASPPPPQGSTAELAASISRKPPPPPPPKKPAGMQAPPPVPLGTRPSFN